MASYTSSNNKKAKDPVEISADDSRRICGHLNDDHSITLYAMARRVATIKPGWKLTDARVSNIALSGCQLQAFICRGDLCEMVRVEYPFVPPLKSSTGSQVRKRMVEIHNQVLSPRVSWLVTKPLALGTSVVFLATWYSVWILGIKESVASIESAQQLSAQVTTLFGSVANLMEMVRWIFWITLAAHTGEVVYALYHCRTTLKLGLQAQFQWAWMIFIAGKFVFDELLLILKVVWSKEADKKGF